MSGSDLHPGDDVVRDGADLEDDLGQMDDHLADELDETDDDLEHGLGESDDDLDDELDETDAEDLGDEAEDGAYDGLDDEVVEEDEHAAVASAATVEAARRLALEGLRKIVPSLNEADVEFIVLEEGSKGGLFGRGRVDAQVEARLRPASSAGPREETGEEPPASVETLRAFVQGVVDRMGVEAEVAASDTPEAIRADISGDDLGILIGRHGATIDALQYLAAIVVNGDRRQRRQVVVDAEGYRARRAATLKALADRTAQKVAREAASVQLKPMTAAERKVIHLHLKDHPRVETVSEGQEPFRCVVISPRSRRG